jgi:hypothetical protein
MQDKIYMLSKLTCDTLVDNITLLPAMVALAIAYVGDAFWNSTFGSSRQLGANMGLSRHWSQTRVSAIPGYLLVLIVFTGRSHQAEQGVHKSRQADSLLVHFCSVA